MRVICARNLFLEPIVRHYSSISGLLRVCVYPPKLLRHDARALPKRISLRNNCVHIWRQRSRRIRGFVTTTLCTQSQLWSACFGRCLLLLRAVLSSVALNHRSTASCVVVEAATAAAAAAAA